MAFCAECGNEFAEGVKFCGGCGANLDGTTKASTPHCSQCGVELAEGTKFSNACGAPTANAVIQAQDQPAQIPKPVGQIECPYCHSSGTVVVQQVKKKKGVSTGKATAALLTGGISLIGTGLAKKAIVSQLTCAACNMTWEA
jgi:ssDNA-binding Zn-finger/Zn-ribbon topoisomerase 1